MHDPVQIAWLAGLIEGEGCFTTQGSRGNGRFSFKLVMTDRDVVYRAYEVSGRLGTANELRFNGPRRTNIPTLAPSDIKTTWVWQVGAQRELRRLILMVFSHLGERRAERCIEALVAIDAWEARQVGRVSRAYA